MMKSTHATHIKRLTMMEDNQIVITAPEVLLDSNLKFATDEPIIKQLTVTRERCINPTLVDSFLRLLRNGSDDIIRQKLSTYSRQETDAHIRSSKCDTFLNDELYPNWRARSQIISFCDTQSKQMKVELDKNYMQNSSSDVKPDIDPRLDPYAARNRVEEQEASYREWRRLGTWIENNKQIESILRITSNRILKQNCDQNANYLEKFWRFQQSH